MKYIATKFFIAIIVLVSCAGGLLSQERYFDERYIFQQSFLHPTLINPGATGYHQGQELIFNYRNAWSDFNGSPKTVSASYDGILATRLGFGALFLQDSYAGLVTTKGQASLSYMIVSPINQLGFGLSAEYIQHRLKNGVISDPLLNIQDQLLLRRNDGTAFFDASFGAYGIYDKKLTYGVSFPSLISSRVDDTSSDLNRSLGVIFNLGYRFMSKSTGISVEPGLIVKKLNNVPTHATANAKFGFLQDKFIGGLSYTIGADKLAGFLIGATVDQVSFYYTYNVTSRTFQDYNNGAHEISVRLNLSAAKIAAPEQKME